MHRRKLSPLSLRMSTSVEGNSMYFLAHFVVGLVFNVVGRIVGFLVWFVFREDLFRSVFRGDDLRRGRVVRICALCIENNGVDVIWFRGGSNCGGHSMDRFDLDRRRFQRDEYLAGWSMLTGWLYRLDCNNFPVVTASAVELEPYVEVYLVWRWCWSWSESLSLWWAITFEVARFQKRWKFVSEAKLGSNQK